MHFLAKIVFTSLLIGRIIATVKCCQSNALNVCLLLCFSWRLWEGKMYLNVGGVTRTQNCLFCLARIFGYFD